MPRKYDFKIKIAYAEKDAENPVVNLPRGFIREVIERLKDNDGISYSETQVS